MNRLIIYTIVISAIIPAIRSFILDVYGGMVAWDYMNGGRRFNCPFQKKKNKKDKKIPVTDISHFLKEAKQTYNDLKKYNDERERQRQAEEERQRNRREQEERDRQEKIKRQKLEQERAEKENRKKQEAERHRLEEEKRLQRIREQLKAEEERKKNEFSLVQEAQERQRIEEIERLKKLRKIVIQQEAVSVHQSDKRTTNESELCLAKTPDDRYDDDAWRDYIFDWKYDHCMIASYV